MPTNKQLINIYKKINAKLKKLVNYVGLPEESLDRYFQPNLLILSKEEQYKDKYFYQLASSLQNSGNMSNSIKFNGDNREKIKKTLCNFNMDSAWKNFQNEEEYPNEINVTVEQQNSYAAKIYEAFKSKGIVDNGINPEREDIKTQWKKYAIGLYDGLRFLKKDNGVKQISELIENKFSEMTSDQLNNNIEKINSISTKVRGIALSLTCDWLKECGCDWLSKPDTHTEKVLSEIYGEQLQKIDVIKKIFEWSKVLNSNEIVCTPYKLDKMIWLLCTGNFYLDKKTFGREIVIDTINNILYPVS